MKTKNWKKKPNDDNEADSPKNTPMMGKIGVDRSSRVGPKELKITEEENDLEIENGKKLKQK